MPKVAIFLTQNLGDLSDSVHVKYKNINKDSTNLSKIFISNPNH